MKRTLPRRIAMAAALAPLTGCSMLASLYDAHALRLIVIVVLVVAVLGFIVSRMNR